MRTLFRSINATPPCGYYEYGIDGKTVTDRSRFGICLKVKELRGSLGLTTPGDGMSFVMEYMCPFMPDGFCTKPSSVKQIKSAVVKANTGFVFGEQCASNDEIERRMETCVSCPNHTTRGFCLDCTGLLDWIYRGFRGRRGPLPADRATGVCCLDEILVAASATAAGRPPRNGVEYPGNCWRNLVEKK
jgi:hypothetical protein